MRRRWTRRHPSLPKCCLVVDPRRWVTKFIGRKKKRNKMRGEKKKKRTERERERKNYSQVYQKSVCAKEWGPHCCDGPREGPDGFFFRLRFVFFFCFVLFFYFLFFVQIEDPKQHLCRARSCYRLLLSSLINEPVQGKPSKLYPPPSSPSGSSSLVQVIFLRRCQPILFPSCGLFFLSLFAILSHAKNKMK